MRLIGSRVGWGIAVLIALASPDLARAETARGTITELNAQRRTFKLKVDTTHLLTCTLKPEAEISLLERRLKLVDVHVGDRAEITFERLGETTLVSKLVVQPRAVARDGPTAAPAAPMEPRPLASTTRAMIMAPTRSATASLPTRALPMPLDSPSGGASKGLVEDAGKYWRQKAFFATDRAPIGAGGGFPWQPLIMLAAVCLVATIILWLLARFSASTTLRRLPAYGFVAALAMLLTTFCGWWFSPTPSDLAEGVTFGKSFGSDVSYGYGWISIPKKRDAGDMPRPSILRGELKPNPERHVAFLENHPLAGPAWLAELREALRPLPKKEIFVFIHGYSVGFEDAMRRTGQLAFDLGLTGPAVLFSWPSQGGLMPYTVDENYADIATDHFQKVLDDLANQTGAETIHLLAHSMGNRVLAEALARFVDQRTTWLPAKLGEIVLAAPDVDRDKFRNHYHSRLTAAGKRLTLYASANDRALEASRVVHGNARAGDAGDSLLVLEKMDSIDVTRVDSGFLGHSYYGDEPQLLKDIRSILGGSKPEQRAWLKEFLRQNAAYWEMAP